MAVLLRNRGLAAPDAARSYLQPRLKDLEDPAVLKGVPAAARRLVEGIRRGERIVVYGDYDVDGMTGTVVLLNFIKLAGGKAEAYIPDRLKEGYSFTPEGLDTLLNSGEVPDLVLTVDHGTSGHEGISRLKAAGVDVIVTDHHEPPPTLPEDAFAIINPRQEGCPSRFKSLCGAAVAFKLAWAASQTFCASKRVSPEFHEFLMNAMAFVALATVADVVPLKDENRILCFHGLRALSATSNPGLKALLRNARLSGQAVQAVHCGFRIGPRLNAAGRMGIAGTAIELLSTSELERARFLADTLEKANEERRALERDLLESILASPELAAFQGDRGLCLGGQGWHVGVIGIVASRLVDRFRVPVIIIGFQGARGRGSARSPSGLHLRDILATQEEHLLSFGGHAGAAGCSIEEKAFAAFKKGFEAETGRAMALQRPTTHLDVDMEIPFGSVRPVLLEELEMLAPHGEGNPRPLFLSKAVRIVGSPRVVGKDRSHLSFFGRQGSTTYRAIFFGGAAFREQLQPDALIDLCYRLKFSTFQNPGAIEIEVKDLTLSS